MAGRACPPFLGITRCVRFHGQGRPWLGGADIGMAGHGYLGVPSAFPIEAAVSSGCDATRAPSDRTIREATRVGAPLRRFHEGRVLDPVSSPVLASAGSRLRRRLMRPMGRRRDHPPGVIVEDGCPPAPQRSRPGQPCVPETGSRGRRPGPAPSGVRRGACDPPFGGGPRCGAVLGTQDVQDVVVSRAGLEGALAAATATSAPICASGGISTPTVSRTEVASPITARAGSIEPAARGRRGSRPRARR